MNRRLFNGPRLAATQYRSELVTVPELRRESLRFIGRRVLSMNGIGDEIRMGCRLCESPIASVGAADQFCCDGCRDVFDQISSCYLIDASAEGLDLRSLAVGNEDKS